MKPTKTLRNYIQIYVNDKITQNYFLKLKWYKLFLLHHIHYLVFDNIFKESE